MTPTKKMPRYSAATEAGRHNQNPYERHQIMTSTPILPAQDIQWKAAAAVELVAGNVRYGLARRGMYNADGLCDVLEIDPETAPELYDSGDYTIDQIFLLAAFFGVAPSALVDDNFFVPDYDPDSWDRLVTARETAG